VVFFLCTLLEEMDYVTAEQIAKYLDKVGLDSKFEPSMTLGDIVGELSKCSKSDCIELLDDTPIYYEFVVDTDKFGMIIDAKTGEIYKAHKLDDEYKITDLLDYHPLHYNGIKGTDEYRLLLERTGVKYYRRGHGIPISLREFICKLMENKIYNPIINPYFHGGYITERYMLGKEIKHLCYTFDSVEERSTFHYNYNAEGRKLTFVDRQKEFKSIMSKINIPLYYSKTLNKIFTKEEFEKAFEKMNKKFTVNYDKISYIFICGVQIFILGGSIDALLKFNKFMEEYVRPIDDNIDDGLVTMSYSLSEERKQINRFATIAELLLQNK
jgi:hypothetical protein